MQLWVVCFVMFFGAVELFQWVQGFSLPLPVLAIGGILLAIVSNASKRIGLPWLHLPLPAAPTAPAVPPAAAAQPAAPTAPNTVSQAPAAPALAEPPAMPTILTASTEANQPPREPQLPNLNPPAPGRSISFTLRKDQE